MELLVVVDMQHDFVDGVLGTPEARAIVPRIVQVLKRWRGEVVFTLDCHNADYLDTNEGTHLPVPHCIEGTYGMKLMKNIALAHDGDDLYVTKSTFGSESLVKYVRHIDCDSITLCGVCTDICVIANAILLKTAFPETPIYVLPDCCAGSTPENHDAAIKVMRSCQIGIL